MHIPKALAFFLQIAKALDHMHSMRLIHGDVRTEKMNVQTWPHSLRDYTIDQECQHCFDEGFRGQTYRLWKLYSWNGRVASIGHNWL